MSAFAPPPGRAIIIEAKEAGPRFTEGQTVIIVDQACSGKVTRVWPKGPGRQTYTVVSFYGVTFVRYEPCLKLVGE